MQGCVCVCGGRRTVGDPEVGVGGRQAGGGGGGGGGGGDSRVGIHQKRNELEERAEHVASSSVNNKWRATMTI